MVGNQGIRCAKRFCVQCNSEHWHHVHEGTSELKNWYTCWCCGAMHEENKLGEPMVVTLSNEDKTTQSCDDRLCDGHCDRCWYV